MIIEQFNTTTAVYTLNNGYDIFVVTIPGSTEGMNLLQFILSGSCGVMFMFTIFEKDAGDIEALIEGNADSYISIYKEDYEGEY